MQGRKVKKVRKSEKQAVQVIEIESEDNISYSASIYTDTTYVPSPGDQNMNLSSNNGAKIGSSTSICRKKNDSEWKQLARNKQMLKPNKFKVTNDNVENRVSSTKVEINTWDKEAVSSISSNDDFDVDVDKVLVAPEENDEVYFMRRIQEVQQLDMKLSQHQIFQLLWQFSNNFDDVICYIKHGYGKDGSLPWNSKDDEVLLTQSREKLQNLVDKYCLNNVINRAAFLDKMDELKAADSSAQ
ncbi:uncharacterized protein LOC141905933 [Tubulanus polymorphus]|uniref:uncharacterized protein LOC141905933 n=1 Tax=Tubulanus polymorphus TaxID=672921 RepID=UPI003DA40533